MEEEDNDLSQLKYVFLTLIELWQDKVVQILLNWFATSHLCSH